ncbi:hypothetical protein [Methylobacterium frigidaeris]|uniref:Uncharacterized protein n=1 Tax=Methylobacterium frigidaeris TaxID=2038277 RepID=A0AA37HHT0_9HYPH|nr:hypothetical protein [Methylobacterium frigidaeris]GJD65824.1 hypothetical protein MPEAHAMD_6020 [Methylobacterium frigidaeris]
MTDLLADADRDACARDATATLEAALDRLSPEMRSAFWAAVDRLYRSEAHADGQPAGAAPGPSLDVRLPA